MSEDTTFSYQVIATGPALPAGKDVRAAVGTEPFLIGSGDNVDLKLPGEGIHSVHARVMATTAGQIILINLGEPESMHIGDQIMPSFKPEYWKPGIPARIGDFDLMLQAVDVSGSNGKPRQADEVSLTQDNRFAPAPAAPADFVIEWAVSDNPPAQPASESGDESFEAPRPSTLHFTEDEILGSSPNPASEESAPEASSTSTAQFTEEEILGSVYRELPPDDAPESIPEKSTLMFSEDEVLESVDSTSPPADLERELSIQPDEPFDSDYTRPHETDDISADVASLPSQDEVFQVEEDLSRTPDMPFAFHIRDAVSPSIPMMAGTLPKDWHQMGLLSAQFSINPVNLVAGERVRIPVSVRNGYDHMVNLRVHVAGLPKEQIILPPQPLVLHPGEVSAFDLVLQTTSTAANPREELMIRLRDPDTPEINLNLSLDLIFKHAPDISGWLDPVEMADNRLTYLHLQNHTRATTTTFITGYAAASGLQIMPAQTQTPISPGQTVKIPIYMTVAHRHLWRTVREEFSVSVQQGNRAPLDYPGIVAIQPRLHLLRIALIVLAFLVVLAGIALVLSRQPEESPRQLIIETVTPIAMTASSVPEDSGLAAPVIDTATHTFTPQPPTRTPVPTITSPPTLTPTNAVFVDPRMNCAVPIPAGWMPYTVNKGDNVFRLAYERGVTVDEVAAVNCLEDPRMLHVGNVLLLPAP